MSECKDDFVGGLSAAVDSALSIRDQLGLNVHEVFFVTETWSGSQVGEGVKTVTEVQMLPTPKFKDYSQDLRLREGGTVKEGDIFLLDVSRNKYKEKDLDLLTDANNVQKLYRVGDKLYTVISMVEKIFTWDIQLREQGSRRGNSHGK